METKKLGDLLRNRRGAQGLTIQALAEKSGVHRTTLSRWENDKSVPFAHELNAVLDALSSSQQERQEFYRALDVPRAVHIASASVADALSISGGEILRVLRTRAKVPQQTVARAANVAQSLVVKWEKGECWPSGAHLHAFCFAVGATEDELVFLTARTWRYIDPLPLDKDVLDEVMVRLSDRPPPTAAATYIALASRYHTLYRAGRISEVEATAVYGYHARHLGWWLKKNKTARQMATPVFAGIERSRGALNAGQMTAVSWLVDCLVDRDDTPRSNDTDDTDDTDDLNGAKGLNGLNGKGKRTLALLEALSDRYPPRFQCFYFSQIARTWERVGNLTAAAAFHERSIESAASDRHAMQRACLTVIDFLCRQGRFEQAASHLRPASAWEGETRPLVHLKNWCNHVEVFAGLGEFVLAEEYLARIVAYAPLHNLVNGYKPEIAKVTTVIETGRTAAGRDRSTARARR